MSNDITFAERFQLWQSTHNEMISVYGHGTAERDPKTLARYDGLVSESLDRALGVLKAPALTSADAEMKRQVWEAEEGHLWGPNEIRDCVAQMLADAAEVSKARHD